VIKKTLLLAGAGVLAALGGSLLHPFGNLESPGGSPGLLSGSQVDGPTLAILQRACRNCHSEQTEWPWYSHVAPVSWMLARDVQAARARMNLSRWPDYSPQDRVQLLTEIGSAVRNRQMPLPRYLLLHPEARLTDAERQQVYRWTRAERGRIGMLETGAIKPACRAPDGSVDCAPQP
jgi:hypothetical protein